MDKKYRDNDVPSGKIKTQQSTREKAGDRKVVGFMIQNSTDLELTIAAKHLGLKKYELLELMWEEFKETNAKMLAGII